VSSPSGGSRLNACKELPKGARELSVNFWGRRPAGWPNCTICRCSIRWKVPLICDTSTVPEAERRELWAHVSSQRRVPLSVQTPPQVPFAGRLVVADVGPLTFNDMETTTQTIRRTPRLTATTPSDYYALSLILDGTFAASQDGRQALIRPGEFVIHDCSRPITAVAEVHVRTLSCTVPRALLSVSPARIARITATPICGTRGVGWVIAPFFERLWAAVQHEEIDGSVQHLVEGTLELMASLFATQLGDETTHTVSRTELLLRIRAYIDANLGDPDLSPEQIAARHHISRSYLDQLFASAGMSVAHWTRERRLERCRRALEDPGRAHESISSIGVHCGLTNAAHLSRLFRDRYGCTPTEYRAQRVARELGPTQH
jgi:AraC-like DNA-binding protein